MTHELMTNQKRMEIFKERIHNIGPQLTAALCAPEHLEHFKQCLFTCATTNPALLKCTPESLLAAAIHCAHLRLFPDKMVGYAYLVPFGDQCQLIIGYAGFQQLVRRSGMINKMICRPIYAGEHFEVEYGTSDTLYHKPDLSAKAWASRQVTDVTHVYMIAWYKTGEPQFWIMPRAEIETYRARSRMGARNKGPWATDWLIMAMKTVLKRGVKFLPVTTETRFAVQLDDFAELGMDQRLSQIPPESSNLMDEHMQDTDKQSSACPDNAVDSPAEVPQNATDTASSEAD